MTQDEIIAMAKEAGFIVSEIYGPMVDVYAVGHNLERFTDLAAAKEREACASLVASWNTAMTDKLAAAIRARSTT